MEDSGTITIKPIGVVKNGVQHHPARKDWQLETVSELVIDSQWEEGLEGLEDFSHILVLFWFDRLNDEEVLLKVHPMHRPDIAVTGMFATRTPNRPNRVGLTVVPLLERKGNILRVRGLDALDGSPIIDIKPYLRSGELILEATEPAWTQENHV